MEWVYFVKEITVPENIVSWLYRGDADHSLRQSEAICLTILQNVFTVDLGDYAGSGLAYQLCFLMTGLYDALVRVDHPLLVLWRNDRLFELREARLEQQASEQPIDRCS